jgi:hypothetical protein
MISGMPAIASINKNNNWKIVLDNCAPNNVVTDRYDILSIMDTETDQLIPLEDSTILAILIYPKCPKETNKNQNCWKSTP